MAQLDPAALPWWLWLACSLVCLVLASLFALFREDDSTGCGCLSIAVLLGIAGMLSGLLGLVRFIKWAWAG